MVLQTYLLISAGSCCFVCDMIRKSVNRLYMLFGSIFNIESYFESNSFSFKLSADTFNWLCWEFNALLPVNLLWNHMYWKRCYTTRVKLKYVRICLNGYKITSKTFISVLIILLAFSHCNTKFIQTRATQT